jgi:hypothetical protein
MEKSSRKLVKKINMKNLKRKAPKKTKNVDNIGRLFTEYSEYSTIQGVHFLSKNNVHIFGKIFWLLVVTTMLFLSAYGSHQGY